MSFQEQKIAGKLEFELAYAVDLTYHFNARRHDFPFEAHLVVRAGALRLNREVVYLQNWLRKDPFEKEEEKVVSMNDDVEEAIFDEQIQALDQNEEPIADFPYCVTLNDKIVDYGRTNQDGRIKRLPTENQAFEYQFYWGEEALLKTNQI